MSKPFIHYFSEKVLPVKVVPKDNSRLMRSIAWFLALLTKLRIVDFPVERFMNDYITTIGRTIYIPGKRPMSQSTELHELVHVLQFEKVMMPLLYLVSRKKRSYYESTACQAWMIVRPKESSDISFERKARQFSYYGIPWLMSLNDLKKRRSEVRSGKPQSDAMKVALAFQEWSRKYGKSEDPGRVRQTTG